MVQPTSTTDTPTTQPSLNRVTLSNVTFSQLARAVSLRNPQTAQGLRVTNPTTTAEQDSPITGMRP
ncbi:hypothetical protein [Legionella impletisoli]|uniref:Uncharacterized protein n=1 Tax=Legionella impletisoli TaxID=343510 RepID=A0A917JV01_9GAMM|nr:hypothetical protein [Legionella impletisoli]GGI86309.1 hypothetical protein GCM10007966_13660 [Legionella impletisoli]